MLKVKRIYFFLNLYGIVSWELFYVEFKAVYEKTIDENFILFKQLKHSISCLLNDYEN